MSCANKARGRRWSAAALVGLTGLGAGCVPGGDAITPPLFPEETKTVVLVADGSPIVADADGLSLTLGAEEELWLLGYSCLPEDLEIGPTSVGNAPAVVVPESSWRLRDDGAWIAEPPFDEQSESRIQGLDIVPRRACYEVGLRTLHSPPGADLPEDPESRRGARFIVKMDEQRVVYAIPSGQIYLLDAATTEARLLRSTVSDPRAARALSDREIAVVGNGGLFLIDVEADSLETLSSTVPMRPVGGGLDGRRIDGEIELFVALGDIKRQDNGPDLWRTGFYRWTPAGWEALIEFPHRSDEIDDDDALVRWLGPGRAAAALHGQSRVFFYDDGELSESDARGELGGIRGVRFMGSLPEYELVISVSEPNSPNPFERHQLLGWNPDGWTPLLGGLRFGKAPIWIERLEGGVIIIARSGFIHFVPDDGQSCETLSVFGSGLGLTGALQAGARVGDRLVLGPEYFAEVQAGRNPEIRIHPLRSPGPCARAETPD